jgi:hypothetical protein
MLQKIGTSHGKIHFSHHENLLKSAASKRDYDQMLSSSQMITSMLSGS